MLLEHSDVTGIGANEKSHSDHNFTLYTLVNERTELEPVRVRSNLEVR